MGILFGRVNSDCIAEANRMAAEADEARRAAVEAGETPTETESETARVILDYLLTPGCLNPDPAEDGGQEITETGLSTKIIAWTIANPGKAAALTISGVAITALAGYIIKKLFARRKRKKLQVAAAEKLRATRDVIGAGTERRGEQVDLTTDEIAAIGRANPHMLAQSDGNIEIVIDNHSQDHIAYINTIFYTVAFYKSDKIMDKPYLRSPMSYIVVSEILKGPIGSAGEKGKSTRLTASVAPFLEKAGYDSSRRDVIAVLEPVTAYIFMLEEMGRSTGIDMKSPIKLNRVKNEYRVSTLGL
jgi:hypothetical protein